MTLALAYIGGFCWWFGWTKLKALAWLFWGVIYMLVYVLWPILALCAFLLFVLVVGTLLDVLTGGDPWKL